MSLMLPFRLKLVMEEKIDYNDLVNSIQEDAGLPVDINKISVDYTNQDAAAKEGIHILHN